MHGLVGLGAAGGVRVEHLLGALLAQQSAGVLVGGALGRAEDAPGIATRSLKAVQGFTALLESLREQRDSGAGVGELLEAVLERTKLGMTTAA